MNLTNEERETIIVYNEKDSTASVFTYRAALKRQLDGLCEERPDDVRKIKENAEGGTEYEVPKKWVKIRPSRILTEEQKEAIRERFKTNVENAL